MRPQPLAVHVPISELRLIAQCMREHQGGSCLLDDFTQWVLSGMHHCKGAGGG